MVRTRERDVESVKPGVGTGSGAAVFEQPAPLPETKNVPPAISEPSKKTVAPETPQVQKNPAEPAAPGKTAEVKSPEMERQQKIKSTVAKMKEISEAEVDDAAISLAGRIGKGANQLVRGLMIATGLAALGLLALPSAALHFLPEGMAKTALEKVADEAPAMVRGLGKIFMTMWVFRGFNWASNYFSGARPMKDSQLLKAEEKARGGSIDEVVGKISAIKANYFVNGRNMREMGKRQKYTWDKLHGILEMYLQANPDKVNQVKGMLEETESQKKFWGIVWGVAKMATVIAIGVYVVPSILTSITNIATRATKFVGENIPGEALAPIGEASFAAEREAKVFGGFIGKEFSEGGWLTRTGIIGAGAAALAVGYAAAEYITRPVRKALWWTVNGFSYGKKRDY